MENLKYVIEDKTIAELLGVQNFTTDESAILELVKNAYDASADKVLLEFVEDQLIITDDGVGMDEDDIKKHWMHVGQSPKDYEVIDSNNRKRVLAGSKGVGRFALARLGRSAKIYSKKEKCKGIAWITDWNNSSVSNDDSLVKSGTTIYIGSLREKWNKRKVNNLIHFLKRTYNDDSMIITIKHNGETEDIGECFPAPIPGKNCLSAISIKYDSNERKLSTKVRSDEFLDNAKYYCKNIDLKNFSSVVNMVDELKESSDWEISNSDLQDCLLKIGDFSADFFFSIKPIKSDMEKFLYKHSHLSEEVPGGVILYRNAFSISSYEGKKDWLGFGKRSRKSPAAATHPTGSWRVRENQISGKVDIDKKENAVLQDLSNRQGLDENIYYELFVEIILTGIKEFERYRQDIIRHINVKNENKIEDNPTPVSDKIVSNPNLVPALTNEEAKKLVDEIKFYRKENTDAWQAKTDVENRYKYDVRILNVLATVGLKASSIAHEMRNDKNFIAENVDNIILSLQEYGVWDELRSPEKTSKIYNNIPYLLDSNKKVNLKLVTFMNAMLSEIEKKQFEQSWHSIADILLRIKQGWERDYAWISISLMLKEDICFYISEDVIQVIFDNLILNSIQQNEKMNHLNISISANFENDMITFSYKDNGKGLDKKYFDNPNKILEVHETTRKNGHGLGMWIVNNTVVMSGGSIENIMGQSGFSIEFSIGSVL